jgi:DNA-binding PadR family transcriptional regulator
MQADWPAENILLALMSEHPMHGYELAQLVKSDAALHTIWRIERSEVYFLLRKLLKHGFIVEHAEERGAGPRRLVYAASPSGLAALDLWLMNPEKSPRNLRTAMLARIYVAQRRDPALAVRLIDAQKEQLNLWLSHERDRIFTDEMVAVIHHFRAAQVDAMIVALDELRVLALKRTGVPAGPEAS